MLSVQRIKTPLHHFNACSLTNGARGRVRTRTGCVLDAVPPLIGLHEKKLAPVASLAPARIRLKDQGRGALHSRA